MLYYDNNDVKLVWYYFNLICKLTTPVYPLLWILLLCSITFVSTRPRGCVFLVPSFASFPPMPIWHWRTTFLCSDRPSNFFSRCLVDVSHDPFERSYRDVCESVRKTMFLCFSPCSISLWLAEVRACISAL